MFNTKTVNMVSEVNLDVASDTKDEPLDVHPPKLLFPFQPNKLVPCSLNITNNTHEHVVFKLEKNIDNCHSISEELMKEVELGKKTIDEVNEEMRKHVECFVSLPLSGIIPAQSTCTLVVTTQRKEILPEETDDDLVLKYRKAYEYTNPDTGNTEYSSDFARAEIFGSDTVHSVTLKAAYVPQGQTTCEEAIPPLIQAEYVEHIDSPIGALDANSTEPWIMTGHMSSRVCIWDYEMQKFMAMVEVPTEPNDTGITSVQSVLFIARKQWFLVGSYDGFIHVYNYTKEMRKVAGFSAGSYKTYVKSPSKKTYVKEMAVHPTHPYVLSLSSTQIKVWDWDKDWECIQTFEQFYYALNQIAFNPMDTKSIAAASGTKEVKVWNFGSPEPKYTLSGHSEQVNCLYFFTRDDQQFLITGSDDKTAKIWHMQKKKCVKTLKGFLSEVISVISHPNLPLLIAGTREGPFYLWSSTNFRLKRVLYGAHDRSCTNLSFCGLACLMGSKRVVIAHGKTLSVVEIHDEEAVGSEGSSHNSILKISQQTQDLQVKRSQ